MSIRKKLEALAQLTTGQYHIVLKINGKKLEPEYHGQLVALVQKSARIKGQYQKIKYSNQRT